MQRILDYLNKIGTYYLATAEGDQPRVRPIGFVMEWEGKLAFCTSNEKPMYQQMVDNPKVEIGGFDGESILRLTGEVEFITSEASQKKALETMPDLANMYVVGDGHFEIYQVKTGVAVLGSMSGEVTTINL